MDHSNIQLNWKQKIKVVYRILARHISAKIAVFACLFTLLTVIFFFLLPTVAVASVIGNILSKLALSALFGGLILFGLHVVYEVVLEDIIKEMKVRYRYEAFVLKKEIHDNIIEDEVLNK